MFMRGEKKCSIGRQLMVPESTLRGWLKNVKVSEEPPKKTVKPIKIKLKSPEIVNYVLDAPTSKLVKPIRIKLFSPKIVEAVLEPPKKIFKPAPQPPSKAVKPISKKVSPEEDEDNRKKEFMRALGLMSKEDFQVDLAMQKLRRSCRRKFGPSRYYNCNW